MGRAATLLLALIGWLAVVLGAGALDTTPPNLARLSGAAGYATGDQRGNITLTSSAATVVGTGSSWLNGVTTGETTAYLLGVTLTNAIWLQFTWGAPQRAVEVTFYQAGSQNQGTWIWRGSNDGGTTLEDIGASFAMGGATSQVQTSLSANTRKYSSYRLEGVSGTANPGPYVQEFQFKIAP